MVAVVVFVVVDIAAAGCLRVLLLWVSWATLHHHNYARLRKKGA